MALTFGVLLLQDRPLDVVLDWAREFDSAGVDSLWVADHLSNPYALDQPWLDPWLTLAAIAGVTRNCRLGPLVSTFVVHTPLALARRVHSLNVISGGRLDLGLGAGGAPIDRAMSGVTDLSMSALVTRLDTGLATFLAMLRGERIPVPAVPAIGARSCPAEITVEFAETPTLVPPIVVGGQGRGTIEVAARFADRWNTFGPGRTGGDFATAFRENSNRLWERCVTHGRAPDAVKASVLLDLNPATSATSRAALVETVGRMVELGVTEVIAYGWADGSVTRPTQELLRFVSEDLPTLRT